jgi:hypothetical protein
MLPGRIVPSPANTTSLPPLALGSSLCVVVVFVPFDRPSLVRCHASATTASRRVRNGVSIGSVSATKHYAGASDPLTLMSDRIPTVRENLIGM